MSKGILLDSHLLVWLDQRLPLGIMAEFQIAEAGASGRLYISDISMWELGVATHRKSMERRPDLRGLGIEAWFREISGLLGARGAMISRAVAQEAAEVPAVYGSGDPGDCFLIATARVRRLSLATHDAQMLALAKRRPDYITVVAC